MYELNLKNVFTFFVKKKYQLNTKFYVNWGWPKKFR